MENILINENKNIHQKDLYEMIKELNTKYILLEKKLKEKDEAMIRDKKILLIMNKNMISIQNQFSEFKKNCEKDINDLREKIEKKNGKEKYDEINYIDNDNELLKKIKSEFDEKKKDIDNQLKKLTDQIKEIKDHPTNKEELKIVENKDTTIFESFENLLAMIIAQGDIDSDNLKKLEKIVEKLKANKISPLILANNFFSENFKYMQNKNEIDEKENIKLAKIKKRVYQEIEEIENKLLFKIKFISDNNNKNNK